jgi:hypothetical protein
VPFSARTEYLLRRYRLLWLAAGAAFAVSGGLERIEDEIFYPWTFSNPPLLARWAGRVTSGDGNRLDLVLILRRVPRAGECVSCSQLEGTAVTCDARGTVRRYRVSGSPKDRTGRLLHLGVIPVPSPPDGLELNTLIGSWDGADSLALDADFVWRRGTSLSGGDDPATEPVPVRLQRQGAVERVQPDNAAGACG